MLKKLFIPLFSLLFLLNTLQGYGKGEMETTDLLAEGRGGGGARMGGGGPRMGGGGAPMRSAPQVRNNISRIPSMSRAQSWSNQRTGPGQPFRGAQAQNFIQQGAHRQRINLQNTQDLQNLQTRFESRRGGQVSDVRNTLRQDIQQRQAAGQRIRGDFNRAFPNRSGFGNDFWGRHSNFQPLYDYGRNNWWHRNTWGDLNNWVGWPYDSSPYYYDSGYPIEIMTDANPGYWSHPSVVYGDDYASYPDINIGPPTSIDSSWLPLGVFAVVNDANTPSTPIMYFQLALNKDGTVGGSYYNQATDLLYNVDGIADQETQSAIWRVENTEVPIFQTGLYNLSLPQTSVDVHFSDDDIQEWLMIRL